jgi:iron(III) transport system ATP-binding protein
VPAGGLTAILGASGSGKTTLLRIVMGLVRADAGSVSVDGLTVADRRVNVTPDKRAIGYMAQEGALFPHIGVAENVGFGLPRSERKRGSRVTEMLELVGLGDEYARRRPQELSGGEQRRVALARALAPRPRLVLLDEPFSGLDASLRAETREAVVRALAQENATAVLVTHDQAEALSMGHEVAVLRDGRIVQTASPAELYRAPTDFDVARFVGEAVALPGQSSSGRVVCALGTLELRSPSGDAPVTVMIRPEQIRLLAHREGEHRSGVPARVVSRVYYGPDTMVQLALESDPDTIVKSRTFAVDCPEAGELVDLVVETPVSAFRASAHADQPLAST